jgi:hypothetical protein
MAKEKYVTTDMSTPEDQEKVEQGNAMEEAVREMDDKFIG